MSQEADPFRLFPYQAIVDRPRVAWPNSARVAVWVIPNIEHFHIEIGNQAPDIRNHSRRDYGNRVGVWRIIEVLAKHGGRGTVLDREGDLAAFAGAAIAAQVEIGVAPGVEFGGAAQGLAGADATGALLGMVDDDDGRAISPLQLAQIGEQRGDLHIAVNIVRPAMQKNDCGTIGQPGFRVSNV